MDSPLSKIDELLSGMLDGVLSDAELRDLEKAMDADPGLQRRLDELSLIRLSMLSGRKKGSLGASFAKSVVAKARAEAVKMGHDAPSWLIENPVTVGANVHPEFAGSSTNGDLAFDAHQNIEGLRWRPLVYAAALLTTAVFAAVLFSLPQFREPSFIGQVEGVPGTEATTKEDKSEKEGNSDGGLLANPSNAIATNDPQMDPNPTDLPNPTDSAGPVVSVSPSNAIAGVDSMANGSVTTPAMLPGQDVESMTADNSVVVAAPVGKPAQPAKDLLLTLVLDFSVDPVAIENRALESILEKHGIVFEDDLVISEDQLKKLQISRLVGGQQPNNDDRMAVIFLKATSEKLDLAMTDIINQHKDFPDFSLDLAMDNSARLLMNQLSEIDVADGASGVARNLARADQPRSASPFAAPDRKGMFSRDNLKASLKTGFSKEKTDVMHVLLLVRHAK